VYESVLSLSKYCIDNSSQSLHLEIQCSEISVSLLIYLSYIENLQRKAFYSTVSANLMLTYFYSCLFQDKSCNILIGAYWCLLVLIGAYWCLLVLIPKTPKILRNPNVSFKLKKGFITFCDPGSAKPAVKLQLSFNEAS